MIVKSIEVMETIVKFVGDFSKTSEPETGSTGAPGLKLSKLNWKRVSVGVSRGDNGEED